MYPSAWEIRGNRRDAAVKQTGSAFQTIDAARSIDSHTGSLCN